MIVRNYRGREKSVGKQQMNARLLLSAVKRIGNDFPILRETRREVLEDAMDIKHAEQLLKWIENKEIEIKIKTAELPSPFALNLYSQGYADIMRIEGRLQFIQRMHEKIMRKIGE